MMLDLLLAAIVVLLGCCTLYLKYCFEELLTLNKQIRGELFDRTLRADRAA